MGEYRKEFWVRCDPCSWVWIIAYLPMDMSKIAKLMKGARCPKCGESGKQIYVAREAEIVRALAAAR